MDYAIVLYMNDEKTAMVKEMIRKLVPVSGSDFCLGIVPHVTLSAIVSDDEEAVKEAAYSLSKQLKRGELKIASLGIFNPLVVFLAPIVDSYLTESCQIANDTMLKVSEVGNKGRYLPNSWVPHMAVAMKMEKEGLYRAFQKLSEIFTPFSAQVDRMALIKWEEQDPYRELAVYELQQETTRISGLHHISLKCGTAEEFEKAKAFYIGLLGFREVRSWPEGIMIDFGNGMLEIFCNGPGTKTKGALRHMAFATDSVDEIAEKVRKAGYEVFIEPNDIVIKSEPEYPARMAFCYGPLGEEIEFFQER